MKGCDRTVISGFSLIEALLSIVVVGLAVALISELVMGATASSNTASLRLQCVCAAQAKMEELLAQPFADLSAGSGSEQLQLSGISVERSWTISQVDIPGTGAGVDDNALGIVVTVGGFSVENIIVDSGDNLYKR